MPLPESPPPLARLLTSMSPERLLTLPAVADDTRYLHWDELRHRPVPDGVSLEEWWLSLRLRRSGNQRPLPFLDRDQHPFVFGLNDAVAQYLHQIDLALGGRLTGPDRLATGEMRDRYLVSSLIEEAITSSQMEGASTTRRIASTMLRTGRAPVTKSERMILNNYHVMEFIRSQASEALTPEMVLEVQRILVAGTLEDERDAGRLQVASETRVSVRDNRDDSVLHAPPEANELPRRLALLCDFANGKAAYSGFLHPIVRAILLHFMLAYDHPFVDGNGRTARALFYWSLLNQGYQLAEFLSISRVLKNAQGQYKRAFLHTETDAGDTTYFVLHQLQTIKRAVDELHGYLATKQREIETVERQMRGGRQLNHRQRALLAHAMRHPGFIYTIESHRASHGVAFATARADLLQLRELRLLDEAAKIGRALAFLAPGNLAERLAQV